MADVLDAPAFVMKDAKPVLAFGDMGGDEQAEAQAVRLGRPTASDQGRLIGADSGIPSSTVPEHDASAEPCVRPR